MRPSPSDEEPELRRAVLINGLIRTPERFLTFLDGVARLGVPDLVLILSTWTGEMNAYPEIRARLSRMGGILVEQTPPDLFLPGHMLHQALTLDLGLSLLDDGDFVFKARPDICNHWDVLEFMAHAPERLPPGRLGPRFGHRVLNVGMFGAHPLYINDIIFAGLAGDLRRLAQISFLPGVKYPRIAPEQWLWSAGLLAGNAVLDAWLSVNPGLIFNDPPRNARLRQILAASPLFAKALAVQAILTRDCLGFLHPDPHRDDILDRASRHTLDALLWDPLDLPGIDHLKPAQLNTFVSAALTDALHDGLHRSSDLGELVRAAMQRYGGPDGARWISQDRNLLQQDAAKLATQLAEIDLSDTRPMHDHPGHRQRPHGASAWRVMSA